jgi:hypothetical protein
VYVAAEPAGVRWVYGFSRAGNVLESQAFVQAADGAGRPQGPVRALSPAAGVSSGSPLVTTARGGNVLARWGETPVVCADGPYGEYCGYDASSALHLRVMRP